MRILDRYLLKGLIYPLLYCLALFSVLFVIIDGFNNLDEFLRKGVSASVIFSYYLYSLPTILVQVIPIAVLVASLYILGRLNRHNEILALKASGVSAYQILTPYLFVGVLLSFAVFLFSEAVVPSSKLVSSSILEGLIKKGKKSLKERAIQNVAVYTSDNRIIFAREYEILSQTLYDVVILEEDKSQSLKSKLVSKKAKMDGRRWSFEDALIYRLDRSGEISGEPEFFKSLKLDIPAKPEDFVREASQIEFMSAREVKHYRDNLREQSRKLGRRISVDLHYKISYPFISLVMILIGAPLAMQVKRGGTMVGLGLSLVVVLVYYGIHSICLALGKSGHLPPLVSAWFGNTFFGILGIYLIKKTA